MEPMQYIIMSENQRRISVKQVQGDEKLLDRNRIGFSTKYYTV